MTKRLLQFPQIYDTQCQHSRQRKISINFNFQLLFYPIWSEYFILQLFDYLSIYYYQMTSVISNLSFLEKLTKDLIRPRKLNYSQQTILNYVDQSIYNVVDLPSVFNQNNHKLKCTLIKRLPTHEKSQQAINKKCIIFLHGLGSSRLEGLHLVPYLPHEYCLCVFDMSGNGKSEGERVTYGVQEQYDIGTLINYLKKNQNLDQFVLWGRSMGAVAILLYSISISNNQNICSNLQCVKCLVIDSPFYDFRQITKYLASKKVPIPEFMVDFALHFMNQSFEKLLYDENRKISYNPFQIKFDTPIKSKIPAIFVCSEIDQVVPILHSQIIIRNYRSHFQKIIMSDVTHNQPRPKKTIISIFQHIEKIMRKINHRNKSNQRGLSGSLCDQRKRGIQLLTPSKNALRQNQMKMPVKGYRTMQNSRENSSQKIKIQMKMKIQSPTVGKKGKVNKDPYYSVNSFCNQIFAKRLVGKETQNGLFRAKRQGNLVKKVQPKLTHSRYL